MRKTKSAAIFVVLAFGGCAQIGESSYETNCARPDEVRSRLVRDLCQQFGKRGNIQMAGSGNTVACSPIGAPTSEALARMFINSKDPPSLMHGGSVAYIYLAPPFAGIVIDAPAEDQALREEVSRAVENSFGNSGCTWIVHQRQFTEQPKLG